MATPVSPERSTVPQRLKFPFNVALATYERAPNLAPDDQPLIPAFAAMDILAEPVVWSDPTVEWTRFDAVLIRSCWDYHLRIGEWQRWLDGLAGSTVYVMNSPALVRWNSDKRYLLDLARRGIATIPTMIVRQGRPDDVKLVAPAEGLT